MGGELNGNYIHVKGIYFDYHDFVCMLGVLFVANLEGVFCQFLSGTSGVKWNLYNDRKKRKKIKGILIDVKNIFLICLTLIWVFISYQTLHHQCGDTTSKDQPPELQAKNYIVYARDNQPCFLSSYIFLYACRELPVKSMHRKKSPYMVMILLLSGDIEKNPGPETTWTTIRHPDYCNYLRVAIYKVFLGERLLPDPASKDDVIVIDVSDGLVELKQLLGQYYQAHLSELKNLKIYISRFMDSMKQWGRNGGLERDQYCDIFSPTNWKNLDGSLKKKTYSIM